jgi:hypothetical protein
MLGITLFQDTASSANVIGMVCGASKAVSPTIVVLIIIFWNPCFKKVILFVVRNAIRKLVYLGW